MKHSFVSGIQQIGIGVENARAATQFYKNNFAMKTLVFDDIAPAKLMAEFTGNKIHKRHALLTMNLKGGGGFEIWQFLDRSPLKNENIKFGDLGIYAAIIKSSDIYLSHKILSAHKKLDVENIEENNPIKSFYLKDFYGNNFKIVESNDFFSETKDSIGGVAGAVIGVSNMEDSVSFYKNLLGVETVFSDELNKDIRTVILQKNSTNKGAFSKLFGDIKIELVQDLKSARTHIYKDRFWGDCGFIHLCLDVTGMDGLKSAMESANYKFSVDSSNAFEMSSASGRFCYVKDPDGTLIELVETHKVPIIKKIGFFLNLQKRKKQKPLADWIVKLMAFSKVGN